MAKLEELIEGPVPYNRIVSVGADGITLVAEHVTIDDPASAWKLYKIDKNGQVVPNDPPFAVAYTSSELSNLAKFGGYTDWQAVAIDFKSGHRFVDGEGYRDEMMPKY